MCIMNWRVAAYTVAFFLVITLPALAQPSTTPLTRPPTDQSTTGASQTSLAEQELIRKLEEAGYTQVRDIKSTAEGIAAKATKDGKEVSLVADSSGKFRER
ncbi:MAG: PepSY domain-containing protein [Rhizomicrobium sp.]